MEDLRNLLKKHGHRMTEARKSVFHALEAFERPLSAVELHTLLPHIDRTSVYRVIHLFLALHIITEVPEGWKVKYELAEPFHGHHHHIRCAQCGATEAFVADEIEHHIALALRTRGYIHLRHSVEVHGICRQCSI